MPVIPPPPEQDLDSCPDTGCWRGGPPSVTQTRASAALFDRLMIPREDLVAFEPEGHQAMLGHADGLLLNLPNRSEQHSKKPVRSHSELDRSLIV